MSNVTPITADDFQAEVLQSPIPVLVDFYGNYCGPCRAMVPVLDQLAAEVTGRAKVVKCDVVAEELLARQFQIELIPTLITFRGGEIISRMVGAKSKQELLAAFDL